MRRWPSSKWRGDSTATRTGRSRRTLGDLQSQLARQSDDLAFYRSIVSPADGIQGLRIQRFEVLPGDEPREVQLKLTLVQAMRHESIVAGLAQITLIGMKDDVPARFSVGDLLGKPRAELPFSFRYFQTIEQTVVLPEGFEPFETEVRVHSSKLRAPGAADICRGKSQASRSPRYEAGDW